MSAAKEDSGDPHLSVTKVQMQLPLYTECVSRLFQIRKNLCAFYLAVYMHACSTSFMPTQDVNNSTNLRKRES